MGGLTVMSHNNHYLAGEEPSKTGPSTLASPPPRQKDTFCPTNQQGDLPCYPA